MSPCLKPNVSPRRRPGHRQPPAGRRRPGPSAGASLAVYPPSAFRSRSTPTPRLGHRRAESTEPPGRQAPAKAVSPSPGVGAHRPACAPGGEARAASGLRGQEAGSTRRAPAALRASRPTFRSRGSPAPARGTSPAGTGAGPGTRRWTQRRAGGE